MARQDSRSQTLVRSAEMVHSFWKFLSTRFLWRFEKSSKITLPSFTLDIAPYDDNMYDSGDFSAQSQEEYDERAREGPIDNDGYKGDVRSVLSSNIN